MDDVRLVRRRQRIGDLETDVQRALGRYRGFPTDQLGKRDAGQELHDEVDEALTRGTGRQHAVVDDVDDVRVPDVVHRLGFVEEPGDDVVVRCELGVKDLERNLLADVGVLGEIHRAHSALTELLADAIVADGEPDQRIRTGRPLRMRIHSNLPRR
jgi:hypothetical protein